MSAEIYLVRHGETEWNAAGRFQGTFDSVLTRRGVAQVEAMGRTLAGLGVVPDAFHASPLGRTRHSAAIIAAHATCPPVILDQRLAEVSLGSWNGLTSIDIDHCYPERLVGASRHDWYYRSPDGESYEAAVARAGRWLADARGTIIAVSHGLIGQVIRGVYLGLDMTEAQRLPVPQDVIWRLHDGAVEGIAVGDN
ncbi:MAG TPA: histidine phosphatase family protein [Sphingobium sp.]